MNSPRSRTGLWLSSSLVSLGLGSPIHAQSPLGYYSSIDPNNATTLRQSVHAIIDDHTRFPYTSTGTDTWNILELAQEDPSNPANIIDVYQNESHPKQGAGNSLYDREHTWPNSYGFPDDNASNYPFSDCHALWLCDISYNSSRGNNPYRFSPGGAERPTVLTNGIGGGSGLYPGNSNWRAGSGPSGSWETWVGRRGDVARSLLYLDVRYEGGTHGVTGVAEPNLILTNTESLIAASNTGSNLLTAYMGELSVLLQWHIQDPPDAFERHRNDVLASYQGNRNPFIDHPEWADCIFSGACATGVVACAGDGSGTGCPCSNNAAPGSGRGCINSLGFGAVVSALGTASLSNDRLVLTGRFMTNAPTLYFQGSTVAGGGSVFGDGLLCAGGAIVRLSIKTNVGGSSFYPEVGDAQVSVQGLVAMPGTRVYQAWYRDAAPFCSSSTFNLSNAWLVSWVP